VVDVYYSDKDSILYQFEFESNNLKDNFHEYKLISSGRTGRGVKHYVASFPKINLVIFS